MSFMSDKESNTFVMVGGLCSLNYVSGPLLSSFSSGRWITFFISRVAPAFFLFCEVRLRVSS